MAPGNPFAGTRSCTAVALLRRHCAALSCVIACLAAGTTLARDAGNDALTVLEVARIPGADIRLDGLLDEPEWASVPPLEGLQVVDPDTLVPARHATRTRLFFNQRGLYVGIEADQPAESLIPRLSTRDGDVNRDGVTFYLDTSGEGIYGYFFSVNLGGTLRDGTLLPERQFSALWDGPWSGNAAPTPHGYSVEMFLPWAMMSMPSAIDETRHMAIGITRRAAYLDETWGWPALPDSQARFISGLQPVRLSGLEAGSTRQLTIYPFSSRTTDRVGGDTSYRVGTDIYWRPATSHQLSATLNPDFGNVESDDVIVNLTAFETFYPEKRPFFLEGNEIFVTSPRSVVRGAASSAGARAVPNSFSLEPTTLLNTRRIGGAPRTPDIPAGVTVAAHQLSQPSELSAATKVTGQQGMLRYGVMLASEEDSKFYGTDQAGNPVRLEQQGRDFGILRLLYEDTNRGRRAIGLISTLAAHPLEDARTGGVDIHYGSTDSRLTGDFQLLSSEIAGVGGYGGFFDINYVPGQGTSHRISFDYLDDALDINDLGFLRRNDVMTSRYVFSRQSSASSRFRFRNDTITLSHEANTRGRMVSASLYYRNTLTFLDRNQLNTTVIYRPARWDDRNSKGNGDYRVKDGGLLEFTYGTDTSKRLSASIGLNTTSEDLGDWSYQAKGGVTYKPNDRFSVDLDFMYRRADNWLVHLGGPRFGAYDAVHWQPGVGMDLFFTARQQLEFSLQWVGIKADTNNLYRVPAGDGDLVRITDGVRGHSASDFNISRLTTQVRYRWEIAPLSDLFVVYTRGGNVPNGRVQGFENLFNEAWSDPIIDRLVVKLRYRFGS